MAELCPDHGSVEAVLEWCTGDDGSVHLGARCPRCRLWLRWVSPGRGAPPLLPSGVPLFSRANGGGTGAQEVQDSHHPMRVRR